MATLPPILWANETILPEVGYHAHTGLTLSRSAARIDREKGKPVRLADRLTSGTSPKRTGAALASQREFARVRSLFQGPSETEGTMTKSSSPPPPGKKIIFRPWKTDPHTGERIYASNYGLRAWPILVDE